MILNPRGTPIPKHGPSPTPHLHYDLNPKMVRNFNIFPRSLVERKGYVSLLLLCLHSKAANWTASKLPPESESTVLFKKIFERCKVFLWERKRRMDGVWGVPWILCYFKLFLLFVSSVRCLFKDMDSIYFVLFYLCDVCLRNVNFISYNTLWTLFLHFCRHFFFVSDFFLLISKISGSNSFLLNVSQLFFNFWNFFV